MPSAWSSLSTRRSALVAIAAILAGCSQPPEPAPPGSTSSGGELPVAMPPESEGALTITFIDVGQGDCTLIECPDGAQILIDCGSTARGPEGRRREDVAAFLDEHLDSALEVLVVTHPDQDHINFLAPSANAPSVLGERRVGRALLSLERAAYEETGVGERLMTWLDASEADVRYLTPEDASPEGEPSPLFACGDTSVYVLAASEPSTRSSESWRRNTPSIVLMIERPGDERPFRVMLTGDATRETEAAILARYSPAFLDVDVLKIGHHGSLTSTVDPDDPSWRWLAVTSPAYAITTAGHHGGYLLPRCGVTDGVLASPSLVSRHACHLLECAEPARCLGSTEGPWCTYSSTAGLLNSSNNGDVTVTIQHGEWTVSSARGVRDDCNSPEGAAPAELRLDPL